MTTVDVVIPVYNEEHVLARSVATLRDFLKNNLDKQWRIIIADNASTVGYGRWRRGWTRNTPR